MSRNGSGTYTPPSNSWNPAVASTTISVADWNTLLADVAAALTGSLAADGQTPATARIPFAQGAGLPAGSAATPALNFTADTDTGVYWISANTLGVAVGGALALTINASGIAPAGGQVAFPATQNASSDANTLDDYEEGTWTPALKFGGNSVGMTYGTQSGRYTKIGRVVILEASVGLTAKGSSVGGATLTGLPFSGGAVSAGTAIQSSINISGVLSGSSISFYLTGSGTGATQADFNDTATLNINVAYSV